MVRVYAMIPVFRRDAMVWRLKSQFRRESTGKDAMVWHLITDFAETQQDETPHRGVSA